MSRVLIIGDIHSSYKALIQVLERANFTPEDTLISLGDLVDSHTNVDDAFLVVDYLRKLPNLVYIVGNHDMWQLTYLETGVHPTNFAQGGWETNISYTRETKDMEQEEYNETINAHIKFFRSGHLYYIDNRNRLFVHGGFDKEYTLEANKRSNPMDFYWNRELWNQALSCKKGKLKTLEYFEEIYIGHTTTLHWKDKEVTTKNGIILPSGQPITKPMYSGGVWNMDTGAGSSNGKLSVMDINSKELFQSDYIHKLYPTKY